MPLAHIHSLPGACWESLPATALPRPAGTGQAREGVASGSALPSRSILSGRGSRVEIGTELDRRSGRSTKDASPAKAGVEARDAAHERRRSATATFPTGPLPSPGRFVFEDERELGPASYPETFTRTTSPAAGHVAPWAKFENLPA